MFLLYPSPSYTPASDSSSERVAATEHHLATGSHASLEWLVLVRIAETCTADTDLETHQTFVPLIPELRTFVPLVTKLQKFVPLILVGEENN